MSRVRRDHPRCRSATWICMSGHTRDLVIYSRFHRNLFRCFGATGGRSLAFPITLAIGFYSSLYYRTIKDWAASICIILNAAYCYRSSVVCVCVCLLVKNGNGKSTRDNGNENGYFFMCAKTPIGRLTLVNFGARYGQFDLWRSVTRELLDRTHWPGMFWIYLKKKQIILLNLYCPVEILTLRQLSV